MFRVPHAAGALVHALDVFKQAKINLTWIESFPTRESGPEYIFFVDFEGHADDARINRALKALGDVCSQVTVLGSCPLASPVG